MKNAPSERIPILVEKVKCSTVVSAVLKQRTYSRLMKPSIKSYSIVTWWFILIIMPNSYE